MVLYSPRTSPSGQEAPLAMLTLSADFAFADGVQAAIPFDVVSFIKGDAGRIIMPTIGGVCFASGPGLWLAQCVLSLSANVDRAECVLGASTGISNLNCVTEIGANAGHVGSCIFQGQFLIPASDTPLHTTPPLIFAGFAASFTGFGAAGNITKAGSSLLLWPFYGFDV